MDRVTWRATVHGITELEPFSSPDLNPYLATFVGLHYGLPPGDNMTPPTHTPGKDCEILELCVASGATLGAPCLLLTGAAQKFTFGEAGITYKRDIFAC